MAWRMPAETARHDRTWMAFPVEGQTLGESAAERDEGYETWSIDLSALQEASRGDGRHGTRIHTTRACVAAAAIRPNTRLQAPSPATAHPTETTAWTR